MQLIWDVTDKISEYYQETLQSQLSERHREKETSNTESHASRKTTTKTTKIKQQIYCPHLADIMAYIPVLHQAEDMQEQWVSTNMNVM